MSRFEAERHARRGLPARRPTAGAIMQRRCIEAKSGDHGESVTVSSIHGDPFPPAATSVGAQFCRTQGGANKAATCQGVGNSARAVIAAVMERAMAAAVAIRFRAQLICRPDGALHGNRGVDRRQGQSATKPRLVSGGGWSGGRKGTGKAGLRRQGKNRCAKNRLSTKCSHDVFKSAFAMPKGRRKNPREL
jgi:hypothetical protein